MHVNRTAPRRARDRTVHSISPINLSGKKCLGFSTDITAPSFFLNVSVQKK
jgi:hypothetical protein